MDTRLKRSPDHQFDITIRTADPRRRSRLETSIVSGFDLRALSPVGYSLSVGENDGPPDAEGSSRGIPDQEIRETRRHELEEL